MSLSPIGSAILELLSRKHTDRYTIIHHITLEIQTLGKKLQIQFIDLCSCLQMQSYLMSSSSHRLTYDQ